jgi:F0F1-type ATP synthase assembly protein I
MIKSLLDTDEKISSNENNTVVEDTKKQDEEQSVSSLEIIEEQPVIVESQPAFEVPEESVFFKKEPETIGEIFNKLQAEDKDIKENPSLFSDVIENLEKEINLPKTEKFTVEHQIEGTENETALIQAKPSDFTPPSKTEMLRQSGLAWSAGVIFFGSVVFMMILGWFADLLLGTSPWGIVGGIIFGSIVGFIQFFRISSQIFKNK